MFISKMKIISLILLSAGAKAQFTCKSGYECWEDTDTDVVWVMGGGSSETCSGVCSNALIDDEFDFSCKSDQPTFANKDDYNVHPVADGLGFDCKNGSCWGSNSGGGGGMMWIQKNTQNPERQCYYPTADTWSCDQSVGNSNCFGTRFYQLCPCAKEVPETPAPTNCPTTVDNFPCAEGYTCWKDDDSDIVWTTGGGITQTCQNTCESAHKENPDFHTCKSDEPLRRDQADFLDIADGLGFECKTGGCNSGWGGSDPGQMWIAQNPNNCDDRTCYFPREGEEFYGCKETVGNANCFNERYTQVCPCNVKPLDEACEWSCPDHSAPVAEWPDDIETGTSCLARINYWRKKACEDGWPECPPGGLPPIVECTACHECANTQSEYDAIFGDHKSFKRCGEYVQGSGGGKTCAEVIDGFVAEREQTNGLCQGHCGPIVRHGCEEFHWGRTAVANGAGYYHFTLNWGNCDKGTCDAHCDSVDGTADACFTTEASTPSCSDSPTEEPTNTPPTASPSDAPTKSPTDEPTNTPPTASPSDAPTNSPTDEPTNTPPTASPSDAPTNSPTDEPTNTPPTASPSDAPTNSPTDEPTNTPPTASPSDAPTKSPTDAPTDVQTPAPTECEKSGGFPAIAGYLPRSDATECLAWDMIQMEWQALMADALCESLEFAESYYNNGGGVIYQTIPSYTTNKATVFTEYTKYYGKDDFLQHWVDRAFKQTKTTYNRGNAVFQDAFPNNFENSGECVGIGESIKTVTAYTGQLVESYQMVQKAIDLVEGGCYAQNDGCMGAVEAIDCAVGAYVGSLEGTDGNNTSVSPGSYGLGPYGYADKRCRNFKNCGPLKTGDGRDQTSPVNNKILSLFGAASHAAWSGDAPLIEAYLRLISNKSIIPLLQGMFRYYYRLGGEQDGTFSTLDKEVGEAGAWAFGAMPKLWACSSKAEKKAYDQTKVGGGPAGTAQVNFDAIRLAFECNYRCLGVTCEEVGSLYDGDANPKINGIACDDVTNGSTDVCAKNKKPRKNACKIYGGKPGIKGRDKDRFTL